MFSVLHRLDLGLTSHSKNGRYSNEQHKATPSLPEPWLEPGLSVWEANVLTTLLQSPLNMSQIKVLGSGDGFYFIYFFV